MQKKTKPCKEMKKTLKDYEIDYIIVDIKAKFKKPSKAKKKNK